jgi:hypothetical protein
MTTNFNSRFGRALNGLYLIGIAAFAFAFVYKHMQLALNEYPLEYNEPGMLVTTATIADGGNPFSLESQPARMSVYPVLSSVIVAPFAHVFGNTLELHRVLGGLFILASCAIVYCLARRSNVPRIESLAAAVLCHAGLLYYSTPVAGPNGLGLFLFFATIAIPWIDGFSTRSLLVAIVLGILAYYTKQYFVAALGYVALYLFLAESKRRAMYFGVAALGAFLVVMVLVRYAFPYYWENTYFVPLRALSFTTSFAHLMVQAKEYLQIYFPVFIILLIAIVCHWYARRAPETQREQGARRMRALNLSEWDKPLLSYKLDYIGVCLACSLIIVGLILGPNRGNHLTYFFQLITPFLVIYTFSLSIDLNGWRWPIRALILWGLFTSYSMLPANYAVAEEGWLALRKEVAEADDVFASTLALHEVVKRNLAIYNNGATTYFFLGQTDLPLFRKTKPGESPSELWERHVELIQRKLKNQEFDMVLLDTWLLLPESRTVKEIDSKTLLSQYYEISGKPIKIALPTQPDGGNYTVQVWKPKQSAPQAVEE